MSQETASIRFLYGTVLGRVCLKILVRPWISKVAGVFLGSPLSKPMVGRFIKKNQIDMTTYSQKQFPSFNDFFTRQRDCDIDSVPLVSPCDAHLTVHSIGADSVFHIKHVDYSLEQLLGDTNLAKAYSGGLCLIFRLTPRHYHRYCYACAGHIAADRRLNGKLHCVRPIAYTNLPVFVQNSREYVVLQTGQLGQVVQMEVGALLVGKIANHPLSPQAEKGQEKGYFEFGGSTIILLLQKNRVCLDPSFMAEPEVEKDVHYGMALGKPIPS